MKSAAVLFLLILFSLASFAQKPKPAKKPSSSPKTTQTPPKTPGGEKEELEKAASEPVAAKRIEALQNFVKNFPKSEEKNRALELIVIARVEAADEKLRSGEIKAATEFFKAAVKDAPAPVSDKLFTETMLPLPTNLYWNYKQPEAAIETALAIEEKIGDNARQLLGLATFYLGTENASQAKRLAQKAVASEPNLSVAYQTLGLASRMNFDLEESADAYAKALELDAESVAAKRSLAEMKRASGKTEEAITLYREILAKDEQDAAAKTGLILSLFDADKKQEAETEMAKSLEANPNNLALLVGAAYLYAARSESAKAIETAQKAISIEPRYVWAYIALARGFLAQKRPLEAERALLAAKQYGNFPTLDYELAAARTQAGFFREAAEALKRSFSIKDNYVKAWIGNRVASEAKSFIELLAVERRASIFEPLAADNPDSAGKLKALLDFAQKLDSADKNEAELVEAAEKFIGGDDEMKPYRQLFVAGNLLERKKALPKVLELTQSVVGKVDSALDAPSAAAAVMADELYESRTIAATRGEFIVVPNIPRQTLSRILRGRIEEITAWALYQQNNSGEAVIRLKRALSVLPEKSAWWRSSMWRLGSAFEAEGKAAEALDAYIKSYTSADAPDAAKRIIIEALYQKVNGNTEGLEQKIGAKPTAVATNTIFTSRPQQTIAQITEKPATDSAQTTETETDANPAASPVTEEKPKSEAEAKPPTEVLTDNPIQTKPTPQETQPTPEIVQSFPETQPKSDETKTEETPKPSPDEAKVETSSSPTAQVKTENTSEAATTETKPEIESKPTTEDVQNTSAETKDATEAKKAVTPKPLFDPIIITVPKPETIKKRNEATDEKPIENAKTDETESKPDNALVIKKDVSDAIASGEMRERKALENKSENGETAACTIVASQDAVSLLNGGGSLGVLVGFQEEGDLKQIAAASSSPKDVEVVQDPDIGKNSGRAFFIIKSISASKGAFTVTFEAPCGKKEILVKVR